MNKFGKILLSSLFVIFIFIIGIYMLFTEDHKVSSIENRELAQKPIMSTDFILKGQYMAEFEDYFTDQFPGRNIWLKAYIDHQRMTNKTFIYDYYITADNWMMPKPESKFTRGALDISSQNLNEFGLYLKQKNIEFYYFSAPSKTSTMQFMLPGYLKENSYLENIHYPVSKLDKNFVYSVDMTTRYLEEFSENELKEFYFKTDHHWNAKGAFEGYKMIEQTLREYSSYFSKETLEYDNYKKKCLDPTAVFEGSSNKQVYMTVNAESEKLCIIMPENNSYENYRVSIKNKNINPFSLYGASFSWTDDDRLINYSDLFTYNYDEINIINEQKKDEGNKILIIKDSYANPMIYHIAQNFYKTTFYDPRYNQDKTIQEFIEQNDFDIVAILYNSVHLAGPNYNFDSLPK